MHLVLDIVPYYTYVMNMKIVISAVIIAAILGIGAYFLVFKAPISEPLTNTPSSTSPQNETSIMAEGDMYTAELIDVTRGVILGVDTQRNSTGDVVVMESPGNYSLVATFENLPDPKGSDFYEGWLVSSNPVAVISTGVAVKEDGKYVNRFETTEDASFYTMYVLTLEPDDNDPASAYHILEGTFK